MKAKVLASLAMMLASCNALAHINYFEKFMKEFEGAGQQKIDFSDLQLQPHLTGNKYEMRCEMALESKPEYFSVTQMVRLVQKVSSHPITDSTHTHYVMVIEFGALHPRSNVTMTLTANYDQSTEHELIAEGDQNNQQGSLAVRKIRGQDLAFHYVQVVGDKTDNFFGFCSPVKK